MDSAPKNASTPPPIFRSHRSPAFVEGAAWGGRAAGPGPAGAPARCWGAPCRGAAPGAVQPGGTALCRAFCAAARFCLLLPENLRITKNSPSGQNSTKLISTRIQNVRSFS